MASNIYPGSGEEFKHTGVVPPPVKVDVPVSGQIVNAPASSLPPEEVKTASKRFKLSTPVNFKGFFIKILIFAGIIILILAVVVFAVRLMNGNGQTPIAVQTPTPTPEEEQAFEPSPYAEDEEVKAIEDELEALEKDLNSISVKEDTLRIPSLDWNIQFK